MMKYIRNIECIPSVVDEHLWRDLLISNMLDGLFHLFDVPDMTIFNGIIVNMKIIFVKYFTNFLSFFVKLVSLMRSCKVDSKLFSDSQIIKMLRS